MYGELGKFTRKNELKPTIPNEYKSWQTYLLSLQGKHNGVDELNHPYDAVSKNGYWNLPLADGTTPEVKTHARHIVMKGNRFTENFTAREIAWRAGINPFTSTLKFGMGTELEAFGGLCEICAIETDRSEHEERHPSPTEADGKEIYRRPNFEHVASGTFREHQ